MFDCANLDWKFEILDRNSFDNLAKKQDTRPVNNRQNKSFHSKFQILNFLLKVIETNLKDAYRLVNSRLSAIKNSRLINLESGLKHLWADCIIRLNLIHILYVLSLSEKHKNLIFFNLNYSLTTLNQILYIQQNYHFCQLIERKLKVIIPN